MKKSYKNREFISISEDGKIEFDTDAIFSGYIMTPVMLVLIGLTCRCIFKGYFDVFQLVFVFLFLLICLLFLGAFVYIMVKSTYERIIFRGLQKENEEYL